MKIDKVIFSCDLNPNYVGFWNSISKHIVKFLGFECQLISLGDPTGKGFSDEYGEIKVVPLLDDYPSIIQALWAKFYYVKDEPDTTWMVGDLDLYPLQRKWFIDNIADCDENDYLHLNYAAYGKPWNEYGGFHPGIAGYYHVGKGSVLANALEFSDSFEEDVKKIVDANKYGIQYYGGAGYFGKAVAPTTSGWFCAEEHRCSDILLSKQDIVKNHSTFSNMESYGQAGHHCRSRVDRSNECEFYPDALISHAYVDMHTMRPYEDYSKGIELVLSMCRGDLSSEESVRLESILKESPHFATRIVKNRGPKC
ncbi:MAG: hypothetical protein CMB80_04670 [Flammeovirgaceae bacterium]|nr:hypothetical protein [Flammeovirgaceae bacterium]|tara:strand:+ start:4397 stop:5326 length:930 start_codon:yes stop_codon:yes gene_type:complete